MKIILLLGVIAGVVNMFLHYDNDPAFWGWLSSTAGGVALLTHEFAKTK